MERVVSKELPPTISSEQLRMAGLGWGSRIKSFLSSGRLFTYFRK